MLLKRYEIDQTFIYLLSLEQRGTLDDSERRKLQNQRAGYAGEEQFGRLLHGLDAVGIWDLALNDNDYVQHDFLVITAHFDIKNFSGTYQKNREVLIGMNNGCLFKNSIAQLERAHIMLEKKVRLLGFQHRVISRIVYINVYFMLKGFNGDERVVFGTQLPSIISHLNKISAVQSDDIALGEKLLADHVVYPHQSIGKRNITELEPSLRCMKCRRLFKSGSNKRKQSLAAHNS